MTFYCRNLPHLQRDFKPHFITSVTKNRWTLPNWARDIVLSCCLHDCGTKYNLHVAVIMPDHVHIIFTPLIDEQRLLAIPMAEIMKGIKGSSAHAINHRLARRGTIWQEESFDHVLRSAESLDRKIVYVLENPIRSSLAADWHDYRWLWRQAPSFLPLLRNPSGTSSRWAGEGTCPYAS
jgi:REP element-mobilizing transposase RayT